MEENGSPPPEFEFDEDHSYFMVRLPVHPKARPPSPAFRSTDPASDHVRDQVAKLLRATNGDMSRLQMQAAMGLKGLRHFREAYLLPALSAGLMEMTIPNAPNSRLQRYRLTQKGHMWLAAHSDRSAARTRGASEDSPQ
jgi:ATP-dependent DNA helicase RecG